ncbi:MAG: hypothetical protein WBG19_00315 [Thermoplasmata archaeon]
MWRELCFCILSPLTRFEDVRSSMFRLENRGILARLSSTPSEVQIEDVHGVLATQPGACRFARTKAARLREAGLLFYGKSSGGGVLGFLGRSQNTLDVRKALVDSVPGLGMKEASHFLRNIGRGSNLAILDVHVRRFLAEMRVVDDETAASHSLAGYVKMEKALASLAFNAGLDLGAFDLAIWEFMRGR